MALIAPAAGRGLLYACGAIALVIVARLALPWGVRAWLAHAYLLLGYWIPAALVRSRNVRFEAWLAHADARLSSGWRLEIGSWALRLGRGIFEFAYLLCYPLVPAAFVVVYALGTNADVRRFWLAVLSAGYVCYITLPWTAARPPRLLDRPDDLPPAVGTIVKTLSAVNTHVLGRLSHQLVTFPSGHVAVAAAAALAVAHVSAAAGIGFGALAGLIAVAAVSGRYHYVVDVLLGLAVGVATALITDSFA